MLLRPGSAGSNTFTDHRQVPAPAIRQVPAEARKPGIAQGGTAEQDNDIAEITHLTSRAGLRPEPARTRPHRAPPGSHRSRSQQAPRLKSGTGTISNRTPENPERSRLAATGIVQLNRCRS